MVDNVRDSIMRTRTIEQHPLQLDYVRHEHSEELKQMSAILERIPTKVYERVRRDISRGSSTKKGRKGISAEQIMRIMLVKQMTTMSYDKLSYALLDSTNYRAFCRIELDQNIKPSTLQDNIKRISPESIEAINRAIMQVAKQDGIETGKKLRADTTNVETNIHEPTDSSLLGDVNRVLHRIMGKLQKDFSIGSCSHARRAKKRAYEIQVAKKNDTRVDLYKDLLKVTDLTIVEATRVSNEVANLSFSDVMAAIKAEALAQELKHYIALGQRVIDQTRRRVIDHEKVPAGEKIVSIFETHTDILVKGTRKVEYGHKICISTGASGLITDLRVLKGNPGDVTLTDDIVDCHIEIFGAAPRQAAFDGGFASAKNLDSLKKKGIKDVAFNKSCGLEIADMVKSTWVYKMLYKFRSSIEGTIGYLKRCFGLYRCSWKGFRSFGSYAWGAVLSANLLILARHQLARASD